MMVLILFVASLITFYLGLIEEINFLSTTIDGTPFFKSIRCTYDFADTGETFGVIRSDPNLQLEPDKFEFFPIAVDEDGVPVLDADHIQRHLDDNDAECGGGDDALDCMLPSEAWLAAKEGNVIGVRDFQSKSHAHRGSLVGLHQHTFIFLKKC